MEENFESVTAATRIYIVAGPTDMRNSFNGLQAIVEKIEPLTGGRDLRLCQGPPDDMRRGWLGSQAASEHTISIWSPPGRCSPAEPAR